MKVRSEAVRDLLGTVLFRSFRIRSALSGTEIMTRAHLQAAAMCWGWVVQRAQWCAFVRELES